jgi:hypothetical protein
MTWKQIKAEALRIVDEAAQGKSDLKLQPLTSFPPNWCFANAQRGRVSSPS